MNAGCTTTSRWRTRRDAIDRHFDDARESVHRVRCDLRMPRPRRQHADLAQLLCDQCAEKPAWRVYGLDQAVLITVESDIHAGLLYAMAVTSSDGSRSPAQFRCVVDLVETYLIDLEAPSAETFCSS